MSTKEDDFELQYEKALAAAAEHRSKGNPSRAAVIEAGARGLKMRGEGSRMTNDQIFARVASDMGHKPGDHVSAEKFKKDVMYRITRYTNDKERVFDIASTFRKGLDYEEFEDAYYAWQSEPRPTKTVFKATIDGKEFAVLTTADKGRFTVVGPKFLRSKYHPASHYLATFKLNPTKITIPHGQRSAHHRQDLLRHP